MAVSSYGSSTDSSGVVRILKDLDATIEGRDVLIVEDIVDSGLTLSYLLRTLRARKPATLEVCALLTKPERREVDLPIRYIGLRDPEPVRDRLRAGLRRALPQPSVRGRSGGRKRLRETGTPLLRCGFTHVRTLRRKVALCVTGLRAHEQVLQERRVSDPDRRRSGVLRPEADQPGRAPARPELLGVPHPGRRGPGQERHDPDQEQHDRRRAQVRAQVPDRLSGQHRAEADQELRAEDVPIDVEAKGGGAGSPCSRTSCRS